MQSTAQCKLPPPLGFGNMNIKGEHKANMQSGKERSNSDANITWYLYTLAEFGEDVAARRKALHTSQSLGALQLSEAPGPQIESILHGCGPMLIPNGGGQRFCDGRYTAPKVSHYSGRFQ